jgi:hypothetical protein
MEKKRERRRGCNVVWFVWLRVLSSRNPVCIFLCLVFCFSTCCLLGISAACLIALISVLLYIPPKTNRDFCRVLTSFRTDCDAWLSSTFDLFTFGQEQSPLPLPSRQLRNCLLLPTGFNHPLSISPQAFTIHSSIYCEHPSPHSSHATATQL